jgi:hypothetical protein
MVRSGQIMNIKTDFASPFPTKKNNPFLIIVIRGSCETKIKKENVTNL